jgi:hypothetical protein
MRYMKVRHRFLRHLPTFPLLYLAAIPIVVLDIYIEIYHRVAFPIYGLPWLKRKHYIKIDRHKLRYLNVLQKIFCVYCGYANGVVHYWTRIFGETERYWCSIKHSDREGFETPPHHRAFLEYGDDKSYEEEYNSRKTPIL